MGVAQDLLLPILTAVLAALLLAALQRWSWFRGRLLFGPLRREVRARTRSDFKSAQKAKGADAGWFLVLRVGWFGRSRERLAALSSALVEVMQAEHSELSGAGTWELLVADHKIERDDLGDVAALMEALVVPGAFSVVTGLLFSDSRIELRRRCTLALAAADEFRYLRAVEAPTDKAQSFARWATDAVGAPILADPLDARAKVAAAVRVWGSAEYVGHPDGEGARYETAHSSPDGCLAAPEVSAAGDYDGRVLVVTNVSTEEDQQTGQLIFVLETLESCYALTEQGSEAWGCKQIPEPRPGEEPGVTLVGRSNHAVSGTRRLLLTSFLSLMTADRKLVLCRRSGGVRSGPGVVSATAGGVFEPGSSAGAPIDRSESGWPDTERSALRELKEELGVDLEGKRLAPATVFLANSKNLKTGRGQLVVCVLYLSQCMLSSEEVRTSMFAASDLASGRFEVDDLVDLDLGEGLDPIEDLARFVRQVERLAPEMDQHAALSCIYSARLLWGAKATSDAMADVFGAKSKVRKSVLWEPSEFASLQPPVSPVS